MTSLKKESVGAFPSECASHHGPAKDDRVSDNSWRQEGKVRLSLTEAKEVSLDMVQH